MNINDEYRIGILIDVNDAQLKTLSEFSEKISNLSLRFSNLTKKLTEFNDVLGVTGDLFASLGDKLTTFGRQSAVSLRAAALEAKNLNRSLAESAFSGHGGGAHGFTGNLAHRLGKRGGAIGEYGVMAGAGYAGGALALGAGALAAGGYLGYEHNVSFQGAVGVLQAGNYSPGFAKKAEMAALTNKLPGVSPLAYIHAVQAATAVTRSGTQGMLLAPTLAKQNLVMQMTNKSWSWADEQHLARFAELRQTDPTAAKIAQSISFTQQMMTTEANKIPAYYFSGFARRFGSGVKYVSDTGMLELLPTIQGYGGSQTGAALRTLQSAFARGQAMATGKRGMKAMEKIGLWDAKTGHIHHIGQFQRTPSEFAAYVQQLEIKAGFKTPEQQSMQNALMFSGLGSVLITTLQQNLQKAAVSVKEGQKAKNLQQEWGIVQKLEGTAGARTSASWSKFATALGIITAPAVIFGLNEITKAFNWLANLLIKFHSTPFSKMDRGLELTYKKMDPIYHSDKLIRGLMTGGGFSLYPITINLDGKEIAKVTAKHLGGAKAAQPSSSYIAPNLVPPSMASNFGLGGLA